MSIYGNPAMLGPRWMTAKKVSILPFQNLHGYDHPWPAGGGDNLLPMTASAIEAANPTFIWTNHSTVGSGLTWTILTDNGGNVTGIQVDGTATVTAVLWLGGYTAQAGTRCYLRANVDTNDSNVYLRLSGPGKGTYTISFINRYSTTWSNIDVESDTELWGNIRIGSGKTVNNLVFKPQLVTGYVPFSPYSNICPISGWEDCRIWVSPTTNPADGTTYQTLFGNPPGTVYGGELDLTTGVLTVDRAMVDMGTLNWQAGTGDGIFWIYSTLAPATYWVPPASDDDAVDFICSKYQAIPFSEYNTKASGIWWHIGSGEYIGFRDPNYVNWTTANVKSDLSGETLIVRLKSPVTYQLTPQQISFFNNQYFGANCGPVLIKVGK